MPFWNIFQAGLGVPASAPALTAAGAAQNVAERFSVEPARRDDAIPDDDTAIPSPDGPTVQSTTEGDFREPGPRVPPTRVIELGRVEIRQSDLDPSGRVRRGPHTETIAVPDVADDAGEALSLPSGKAAFTGIGKRNGGSGQDQEGEAEGANHEPCWRSPLRTARLARFSRRLKEGDRRPLSMGERRRPAMTSIPISDRTSRQPYDGRPLTTSAVDLDDTRLLARLLEPRCANPETTAAALLADLGGLGAVMTAEARELTRIDPASLDLATELRLLRDLAVRLAREDAARRPAITSWTALVAYVRAALAHEPREQFRTLYLDKKNCLLRDELVAYGTIDHAPVYPREVVRRGLELSASALVLVHNHPSGDPTPSRADIDMTRKIVEAARVFDLQVHDHLVVGRHGTASFKQLGLF